MLKTAKLVAVLIALAWFAHPGAAMAGCTDMTRVSAAASLGGDFSSNPAWSDVGGGTVTFQTASASCVLVKFNVQVSSATNFAVLFQAVLDNNPCQPSPVQFAAPNLGAPNEPTYLPATFFCYASGAGTHTVQMQFQGAFTVAKLGGWMLEAWHK